MFADFIAWFSHLHLAFQVVGYLLFLPLALMGLGLLICAGEPSAGSVLNENGSIIGLMLLGGLAAAFLGSIFGTAALFYYFVYPNYALAVVIGLVFGLVVVPRVLFRDGE